uniref:CSON004515 protein n=1 Tax=Culicoides sonorensis TaxID=179676 RepID=A0A336LTV3_CULSO
MGTSTFTFLSSNCVPSLVAYHNIQHTEKLLQNAFLPLTCSDILLSKIESTCDILYQTDISSHH